MLKRTFTIGLTATESARLRKIGNGKLGIGIHRVVLHCLERKSITIQPIHIEKNDIKLVLQIKQSEKDMLAMFGDGNLTEGFRRILYAYAQLPIPNPVTNEPKHNTTVSLVQPIIEHANNLGNGNITEGVRWAMEQYPQAYVDQEGRWDTTTESLVYDLPPLPQADIFSKYTNQGVGDIKCYKCNEIIKEVGECPKCDGEQV